MSESYKTAARFAEEAKEWPLLALLGTSLGEKHNITLLASVFKTACAKRDDKAAARYFGWTMQAIEDAVLSPWIRQVRSVDVLEWNENVPICRESARRSRATQAIELWSELPATQRGSQPVQYAMDDIRSEPIAVATLLTTRETILTEVANRWRSTTDEKEADTLFSFLCMQSGARFDEERKILIGVLRKATDGSFPVSRLTRQLASDSAHLLGEIMTILAIARARNCKSVDEEISVLRPLEGCTDEAYRMTALFAADIAALDRRALALREVVQPEHEIRYGGRRVVGGNLAMTYPNLTSVAVTITQVFDGGCVAPDDWGNGQFELARTRALSWKETNPGIDIQLSLTVSERFADKPAFTRQQKL